MIERGEIKKYFSDRGFGFIAMEKGEDVFFHIKDVDNNVSINEGDSVEFVLAAGRNGRIQAQKVKKISTGLSSGCYKIPADTRAILDLKEVDNFFLRLNRLAYYNQEDKNQGFKLLVTDRQNIKYKIDPNFSRIDFKTIVQRQESSIRGLGENIVTAIFIPDWRVIVGLGQPSVYETSITLHHLYGIPYLPGSALKGITRRWVITEVFGDEAKALNDGGFRMVFGGPKWDKLVAYHGAVRFFDAFPLDRPEIQLDIINPHYSTYYTDSSGKKPPGDYDDPKPIMFLTVETKSGFQILLSAQDNQVIQQGEFAGRKPLDVAHQYLMDALINHGIGAKTAVGYGYALAGQQSFIKG